MKAHLLAPALVVLATALAGRVDRAVAAAAPVTRTWVQTAGGWWGTPANWFGSQLPDSSHEWAWLPDFAGGCNVLLDRDCSLGGVILDPLGPNLWLGGRNLDVGEGTISNGSRIYSDGPASTVTGVLENLQPGSVRVRGGSVLTLQGPRVDNAGTIYVNENQANAVAGVTFAGADTLAGTGDLWLYAGSPYARLDTSPGGVLTNLAPHLVHGLGDVNARLVNQGTLQADAPNNVLYLRGADKTNQGLFQAISGGWLVLDGARVDNAGGRIAADGGTVGLQHDATIAGGTLSTLGAGAFTTLGNARLENVTNRGVFWIRGGDSVAVTGPTFANDGVVYVNSNQASAAGRLRFEGDVTMSGHGSLWMYNGSPYSVLATSPGGTLTQAAGHTIHGLGQIDAHLVNAGTVKADAANNVLVLGGSGKTNTGTMTATNSGWLVLDGMRLENDGGQVRAEQGTVGLQHGAAIHGGTLSSQGSGVVTTLGNARLEALTSVGMVQVRGGDTLTVAGSFLVNDGALLVNSNQASAYGVVACEGNVQLSGSGHLWLYGGVPYARLESTAGGTLTNRSGHTIHGSGEIRAPLVNAGLVKADVANNQLVLDRASKTNTGLLKAVGSSWLTIDSVTVANVRGEIRAEGGGVILARGARVQGGALSSSAGGFVYTSANARLESVTNRSTLRVPGGDTLTLGGGLVTNDGTILVNWNQSVATARVSADGDVSLAGAGDLLLYNSGTLAQVGSGAGSVLRNLGGHTIHGAGTVAAHVVNSGLVCADFAGTALYVTDPAFSNTGVVEARNGALLEVVSPAANFAGGTLSGGTWRVHDGSTLWVNGAAVTTNQAIVDLDGPNSRLTRDAQGSDALAGLAAIGANGMLTLRGGRALTTPGALANAGSLVLGPGSVLQVGNPGGAFTQAASGAMRFEIGGRLAAQVGQLKVAGTAALGGVLAADSALGFTPSLGDTFLVMTYASHTGAFDHFEAPVVNGLRLTPTVYSNRVVLTAVVPSVAVDDPPVPPRALAFATRLGASGLTRFELALPSAAHVRLAVYDVRGRLVATLCDAPQDAGVHEYAFTDRSAGGAGPGVYFGQAVVTAGGGVVTRTARAVLLR